VVREIAGRLLRPPFWFLKLIASLPVFRLRDVVFFVERRSGVVALTLDDGPDPVVTPHVLDVLTAHNARATFFLLGERAERYPEVVRRIASEGHELGNHTWRDESSAALSPSALSESLARTQRVLGEFGTVRLFRPGGGSLGGGSVVALAERNGYRCVLGSVYPHDVRISSTDFIVKDVLKRVRGGAIIVLHEGMAERARVTEILSRVLAELGRRNYTVTTVSDLLDQHWER
jgi:peptidoglycan/xylan/chitin deacetylase (PgdA/CDA1 family)